MRPNEAATGEGKQQEKESSQDRQTMPSECGKKHKPQKKLPATQQQQNHNNNKERVENEEEEAEKNVNVREKFGLKFAYEQILRCFIKFSTRQDESKTSEAS